MTDPFTLSVLYKGNELQLPAQLILKGYVHQFRVMINDTAVFFEPDEEGHYRALIVPDAGGEMPLPPDAALLQAVHEKIIAIQQ